MKSAEKLQFSLRLRIVIVGAVMLLGLLLLWFRCFAEQVRSGSDYREQIARQSIRRVRIPARRGKILSFDQVVLADNQPCFQLIFYPEEMRSSRNAKTIEYMLKSAEALAGHIWRKSPLTAEIIQHHIYTKPGLPLVVFDRLTAFEAARLFEKLREHRGADIQLNSYRVYPRGHLACHLVGTTRYDDSEAAYDRHQFFYYLPDLVGRDGIEKAADLHIPGSGIDGLRGRPGYSLMQVDKSGFRRRTIIGKIEPIHGNNLVLTIDSRAQKILEDLLQGARGAIVVVDVDNGDVIGSASSPGYDLRRFSPKLTSDYYQVLLNDPGKPLLNRALQGTYTPGSILKPLVALGFLNAGVTPEQTFSCTGYNQIGNATIRCTAYRRGGHGEVDLPHALRWSCNSYMIENIQQTGKNAIIEVLTAAGLGEPSGIELPERAGIFPSDEQKRRIFRSHWNSYDSALLSIGQGIITLTPLQAALYTAAIANGGKLYRPHLISGAVDPFGNEIFHREPVVRRTLPVTPEQLDAIRQGMWEVVNASDGSGRRAQVEGLNIYGKTGSAEVGVRPNLHINGWFVAFTEYENRRLAIAVLLENARSGGASCAPLAGDFFRRYLLKK